LPVSSVIDHNDQ